MQQDNQNSDNSSKEASYSKSKESALDASLTWLQSLKNSLLDSIEKLANLEQTNFQLALKYLNSGAYRDAIFRLKIVQWLNPKNPYADYLIGKAYVLSGKFDKAKLHLKKTIAAKPEMEEAKFYLAVAGVGGVPMRVPPSIQIEQLEAMENSYEEQIANGMNRAAYTIGTKILTEVLDNQQGFDVLDLDIRTGKSGDYILPIANNIVGVEPCMQLISQARNRRIDDKLVYNELITKTALDMLQKDERKFDIVQAYFSSVYLGDLEELFKQVANHLRQQKLFLLAVEANEGDSFAFNRVTMSFRHSLAYLEEVAAKTGFEVMASQKINPQNPNSDLVLLLKKKN